MTSIQVLGLLSLAFVLITVTYIDSLRKQIRHLANSSERDKQSAGRYGKLMDEMKRSHAQWMAFALRGYAKQRGYKVTAEAVGLGRYPSVLVVHSRTGDTVFELTYGKETPFQRDDSGFDELKWSTEFESRHKGLPRTFAELGETQKITDILLAFNNEMTGERAST